MSKCHMCGKTFDKEEAREIFEDEYSMRNYDNFVKPLCGECAKEIFEDQNDGYYKETCDYCGKQFDPFIEEMQFSRHVDGISLTDVSFCICSDCAFDDIERRGGKLNPYRG